MALAYYGVRLSDNWLETPEKYLVFKNAVIGRTGFQTYKGYELDREELRAQDVRVEDDDEVNLFRSPEEVFSAKTIASFQCKSITDGHPSELLSIENVRDLELGQVFNVRQGKDALDSGDFPLLADLVVKDKSLIEKIRDGLRELSCGYNYHVLKSGDVLNQVDIVGNHVAVVQQARAGREAVIVDAAPTAIVTVTPSTENNFMATFLDNLLNRTSKPKIAAWAKDAKPEEVAELINQLSEEVEKRPQVITRVSVATDNTSANDNAADRKRMHDALDRRLDGKDAEEEETKAADKELSTLFKGKDSVPAASKSLARMFGADEEEEEEEEEEKKKKGEDGEDGEEGEDEEEEEGKDELSALTIEPEDRPKSAGPGTDQIVAARREGAAAVLKSLKPHVARSGDKKLLAAYDTVAKTVQGKSVGKTSDGYSRVAKASTQRSQAAMDSIDERTAQKKHREQLDSAEKLYADRFKKN